MLLIIHILKLNVILRVNCSGSVKVQENIKLVYTTFWHDFRNIILCPSKHTKPPVVLRLFPFSSAPPPQVFKKYTVDIQPLAVLTV